MKKKIGITLGDPAGIGPEIVLKAIIRHPDIYEKCFPVIYGDPYILNFYRELLGLKTKILEIADLNQLSDTKSDVIYCLPVSRFRKKIIPGKVAGQSGLMAYNYIKKAVEHAIEGKLNAIVTAPINKEALKMGGVPYLDHTAILSEQTNSPNTMTLFVTGNLRIFFYSRHIAFREIADSLNKSDITESLRQCHKYLEKIGIKDPEIAVAALNPHSGENGMFGREEIEILFPAVKVLRKSGLKVDGPVSADSVFHQTAEGRYDAVLALYHDQGHIAAKTYDFHRTVSITMGLPFLRSSVDHGTAMDIAGKNIANETSMVEAIDAAIRYSW
ncbi:MAG: 4-hydroxythreonine-4-phosphate dehydrogenase PdxA [Calditrichaceae bacterium]